MREKTLLFDVIILVWIYSVITTLSTCVLVLFKTSTSQLALKYKKYVVKNRYDTNQYLRDSNHFHFGTSNKFFQG